VLRRRRDDVEDADRYALKCAQEQRATGVYRDVHCSTFTPRSFLDLWATMCRLDLVGYQVATCYPTEAGHYEFFVTLQKVPGAVNSDVRRKAQLESVDSWRAVVGPDDAGPGSAPTLSDKERRLIEGKRALLQWARAIVGSARSSDRGPTTRQ
jgi:hypothetical protein